MADCSTYIIGRFKISYFSGKVSFKRGKVDY